MDYKNLPKVSIIMPVRNEERYITQSLSAVLQQDYPADKMEILISDGMSTDKTRHVISNVIIDHDIPVIVLDNPGLIVPTGMNIAIKKAKANIIVRVDGHTIIAPDYVRQCVNFLEQNNVDNVGGPMRAVSDSFIGKVIILATSTPFGLGNSAFHYSNHEQFVDTVYMGAFRKETLQKVGLYDENFVRHQDYELNYRIRKSGGKILLSPIIRSTYYARDNLRKLLKQYFQYGYWKGRLLRRNPDSIKWRHAVPPLFIFTLVLGLIAAALNIGGKIFLSILVVLYCIFLGVAVLAVCRSGSIKYAPILAIIFASIHLSWGFGVWCGLLAPKLPNWGNN